MPSPGFSVTLLPLPAPSVSILRARYQGLEEYKKKFILVWISFKAHFSHSYFVLIFC